MIDGNVLLSNVDCRRGAPMGRPLIHDNQEATVTLFRIRFVDGDYDRGGAYWGGGTPVYIAIGDDFQHSRRADSLADAKSQILELFPKLKIEFTEVNDDFLHGYLEASLRYSTDGDSDEPLDANYDVDAIVGETLTKMVEDCRLFLSKHESMITDENCLVEGNCFEQAGKDFWLTRNHHGAGFWDGNDWEEMAGNAMTHTAHEFGDVTLYVGDDGKLYNV